MNQRKKTNQESKQIKKMQIKIKYPFFASKIGEKCDR